MKFHNVSLNFIVHRRLMVKFLRALTFLRIFNCVGIIIESHLLSEKPRFKPYAATIEASRLCNLRCSFCPANQEDSNCEGGILDLAIFKKFVDENPQFLFLFFTGNGEPNLNEDLSEMIDYARSKKIITILSTNGVKEVNSRISPDFLIFSLDFDNAMNYQNYKRSDCFYVCLQNIKKYNLNKKKDTLTFLQFFIEQNGEQKIEGFKTLNKKVDCNFIILKRPIVYSNKMERSDFGGMLLKTKSGKKLKCKYIYYQVYLTSKGLISICCNDVKNIAILGDEQKDSFIDIWNNIEYQRFRKINKSTGKIFNICYYCPRLYRKSPLVRIVRN